jgi:hypothetical protein
MRRQPMTQSINGQSYFSQIKARNVERPTATGAFKAVYHDSIGGASRIKNWRRGFGRLDFQPDGLVAARQINQKATGEGTLFYDIE